MTVGLTSERNGKGIWDNRGNALKVRYERKIRARELF